MDPVGVRSPANPGLGASARLIRPGPFRKPVPATASFALKVRHSSAALWADQVKDRGNNTRVQFAWWSFKGAHKVILTIDSAKAGRARQRRNAARVLRCLTLRAGWLRSPFMPCLAAALLTTHSEQSGFQLTTCVIRELIAGIGARLSSAARFESDGFPACRARCMFHR